MDIAWTPGIGDPSLMGWFTVAAYLGTAGLCARAAARTLAVTSQLQKERSFWMMMTFLFVLLGINKQLDLQTLFTEIGRTAARAQGWYDDRRFYQRSFIVAAGLSGAAVQIGLLVVFRRHAALVKVALVGLFFTGTFVVIRAASFHHVDFLLGTSTLGLRWNWILELTGIALVAVPALLRQASPRTSRLLSSPGERIS